MYDVLRIVGVDLGQQRDPTAICVVERGYVPAGKLYNASYWVKGRELYGAREPVKLEYHMRHLERPALGTSYVEVVERVVELLKSLGDEELVLAVDTTGVGRPVADMLKERLERWLEEERNTCLHTAWITITGGDSVTKAEGGGSGCRSGPCFGTARPDAKRAAKDSRSAPARPRPTEGAAELQSQDQHRHGARLIRGVARGRPRRPGVSRGTGVLVRERYMRKEDSLPRPGIIAQEGVPINVYPRRASGRYPSAMNPR
jgi:hypothetical protein